MKMHLDWQHTCHFLSKLYPDPWPAHFHMEVVEMKHKDDWRPRLGPVQFVSLEEVAELDDVALRTFAQIGCHFFFTVAMTNGGKRIKSNMQVISALWADTDDISEEQMNNLILGCPHPPTGIVRSGGGYHFYWKLKEYYYVEEGKEGFQYVEQALRKVHGWVAGDHTTDISRLLRLPGTFTYKPWKYAEPMPCMLVSWVDGRTYSIEELINTRISLNEIRLQKDFVEKYILLGEGMGNPPNRSDRDFAVIKELISVGHTLSEIKDICFNPDWGMSSRFLEKGQEYFERTWDKCHAEVGKGAHGVYDDGKIVWFRKQGGTGASIPQPISNFCIIPHTMLRIIDNDSFLWDTTAFMDPYEKRLTLSADQLLNSSSLRKSVGLPGMAWLAGEQQFQAYIQFLQSKKIPSQDATYILGWNGAAFVLKDETLFGEHIQYQSSPVGEMTISVTKEQPYGGFRATCQEFFHRIATVHKPEISIPTFGWFLACAFARRIRDKCFQQFPLLILHGQRGSGKTSLIRVLLRAMYGVESDYSMRTTSAVLRRIMMTTNAFPLFLDEYDPGMKHSQDVDQMFRVSYQAGSAQHFDISKDKVMDYPLVAPVALTTMFGVNDDALQDRAINIRLTNFNAEKSTEAFLWLQNQISGVFLHPWLEEPWQDWVAEIPNLGKTLGQSTERQQLAFGVMAAPLLHINKFIKSPLLRLEELHKYWELSRKQTYTINHIVTFEIILAYLIRDVPHFLKDESWRIEGDILSVWQSKFADCAQENQHKLGLPATVTRKWILATLRDMLAEGQILDMNKNVRMRGNVVSCFQLNICNFTTVAEVVTGLDPED